MRNHVVAGVWAEQGEGWRLSFAGKEGYRYSVATKFVNDGEGIAALIATIKEQLVLMAGASSRVILVDELPNVDPIYYCLAKEFSFPLVVSPLRLKLHELRLGRSFDDLSYLAVEAAVTGLTTEMLLLESTNVCTFRCLYCMQDGVVRKKARMSFVVAEKIISEYACTSLGTVGFHLMGEPTVNPDLAKIIGMVADFHIGHALTTNASLLTGEKAKILFAQGLNHLMLSIQTATPAQHLAFKRPLPQFTYERILENVKGIMQARWEVAPEARLEIHVMDTSTYKPRGVDVVNDDAEAERVVSFWRELTRVAAEESGHRELLGMGAGPETVSLAEKSWPYGELRLAPHIFLTFKKAGYWIQNFLGAEEYVLPARSGTCKSIGHQRREHRQMAILANGEAVLCCYDYNGGTAFARIGQMTLGEIDGRAEELRMSLVAAEEIPFAICRRCLGLRLKGLDCRFAARKRDGMIAMTHFAVYGLGAAAMAAKRELESRGLVVAAFVAGTGEDYSVPTLAGIPICLADSLPAVVEAVIFPSGWREEEGVVVKMQTQYLDLLLAQIDPVALDPYRQRAGSDKPLVPSASNPGGDMPAMTRVTQVLAKAGRLNEFWAKMRGLIGKLWR